MKEPLPANAVDGTIAATGVLFDHLAAHEQMRSVAMNQQIPKTSLSRRRVVQIMGAAGLAAGAPALRASSTRAQDSLTFLTYAVYSDPRLVDAFTKQSGVAIVPENFGELDEMVTKLRARGSEGFDIVSVASNLTKQLFKEELLLPVDTAKLSNWKNLDPAFGQAGYVQTGTEGQVIGVPTVWGPEGLIYRTDLIETPVDSWSILWDESLKGQLSAIDYGYEMILIAALYLGYQDALKADPIVFTDEQFDAIKQALIEQKALLTAIGPMLRRLSPGWRAVRPWPRLGASSSRSTWRRRAFPSSSFHPRKGRRAGRRAPASPPSRRTSMPPTNFSITSLARTTVCRSPNSWGTRRRRAKS